MGQLIAHCFGDYIAQSTWMALNKSKRSCVCVIHCSTYTLCFLALTHSWKALLMIFATHFLIDRFGLARYLVWLKEGQSPLGIIPWRWCSLTGYFDGDGSDKKTPELYLSAMRPIWIRVWLTIVADNTLHLLCNAIALAYL